MREEISNSSTVGLFKFFLQMIVTLEDSEILELSKKYESEIKQIKHEVYKLSWYMRGGVDANQLLSNTDVEDLGILGKIISENIETTKKSGMPLI